MSKKIFLLSQTYTTFRYNISLDMFSSRSKDADQTKRYKDRSQSKYPKKEQLF